VDHQPARDFRRSLRTWRDVDGADDTASILIFDGDEMFAACLVVHEAAGPLVYDVAVASTHRPERALAESVSPYPVSPNSCCTNPGQEIHAYTWTGGIQSGNRITGYEVSMSMEYGYGTNTASRSRPAMRGPVLHVRTQKAAVGSARRVDRTERRLRKLLLVAAALVACLLAGCGGPYAKLTNYSMGTGASGCEYPNKPYYWGIWSVEASRPTTITGAKLDPPNQAGLRVVKKFVETKNSGGGGNFIYSKANMQDGVPKGYTYDQWTGVEPIAKAAIPAHKKVTFDVILEPERVGTWKFKGLRVYWDHTSKLIPTILTVKASTDPNNTKACNP